MSWLIAFPEHTGLVSLHNAHLSTCTKVKILDEVAALMTLPVLRPYRTTLIRGLDLPGYGIPCVRKPESESESESRKRKRRLRNHGQISH